MAYIAYTKTADYEKSYDGGMVVEVNVGDYYGIDMICFVENTKISTAYGNKNIQDVSIGDLVYSKDVATDDTSLKPVVRTFVNYTEELVHIHIDDEIITTTPTHPFWVNGQEWKKSIELTTEDMLLSKSGEIIKINSIEYEVLEQPVKVYNFEVADFHTYFVSETEVLVHNRCLTNKEAAKAAAALGYHTALTEKTKPFGTTIFTNGKNYITIDKTAHGTLNTDRYMWKMANSVAKLNAGSYATTDENLNILRIKK